ncbi:hypothetical protein WCLP8_40005 [uncultured Gammaproteobacteria bacterium]
MTVNVTAVNDVPTAAANTKTAVEDTALLLAAADFGFADVDTGAALSQIQITALPTAGSLWVDADSSGTINNAEAALIANDTVSLANIAKLTYLGALNSNGNGYGNFSFKVHDGTAYSASAYLMTVNVTAVNDVPTASPNPTLAR